MSKWSGIPVIQLLIILASGLVIGAPPVLARDDSASEAGAADTSSADRKRGMISTGLDSDAISAKWPNAAVWLEPPEEKRVLGLFEPEADTPARGALVILADEGQSAASGLAGALRQPMARAGWAVMTVGLEPPPYAVQQARRQQATAPPDVSPESAGDTEATASVMIDVMDSVDAGDLEDRYRARIQKVLSVAVAELTDRGYDRVAVAGVGLASGHVARMATSADGEVSALVWIAPVFTRSDSVELTGWLSGARQIRVLELHSSRAMNTVGGAGPGSPEEREAAFRRADIAAYTRQPVAMAERPAPRNAAALANRLSAWLAPDH
ncbi:DUF3530 family protein [Marinobacter orientalis]|uniref:DUF3530 family protein n=1 Tax=Marinobacter orientalis TaxID=1928859 RepID=A0A7Y0NJZ7_9GAMM|nr:DUF3530 family protein [Marinobacter orientalis]NMT62419.1 DUF3530 family protein [Marinobacter orientalis]TGX51119.1 DUF3530 family protein [Marinobacter orientalis]